MKHTLLVLLALFFSVSLMAQTPTGRVTIPKVWMPLDTIPGTTPTILTDKEFAFDIYLVNVGAVQFAYNAGQYGINFNPALINGGALTPAILASGLGGKAPTGVFMQTSPDHVRVPQNTFGDGGPFIPVGDSVLVVRIKLTNTVNYPTDLVPQTPDLVLRPSNPNSVAVFRYSGGTPAGTGNTGTAAALSITRWTYVNPPIIPVPVELTSFSASMKVRDVVLDWETKTEVNSSTFVVERAAINNGAKVFTTVGQIPASGNSNSPKSYSFTDKKLQSGKYVYRLKMIDNDGTFDYSSEVEAEVSLPKEYAISQNYPNPFNPSTRIDYQLPFDSKVSLELYGITGEKIATIINQEVAAGYYTADINAASLNLASGVYIYRLAADNQADQNFVQVKKLMLTK